MNEEKDIISLTKILKEHSNIIITVITFLTAVVSFVIRFYDYINFFTISLYYNVDKTFYEYQDGMFFNFTIAFLIVITFLSLIFSCKNIYYNFKAKKYRKILIDILIIMSLNCIIAVILNNILWVLILIILETIFCFISSKAGKYNQKKLELQTQEEIKNSLITYIKRLPAYIVICLFISFLLYYTSLLLQKDFRLIENSDFNMQVIIYETKDYYILADCKIDSDNNQLIILSNYQEKVDNENIKTKYYKFDSIEIVKEN